MNLVFSGLLRLLAVLGFGFVSYTGFDTLITTLVGTVTTTWTGMGSKFVQLSAIGGFTDALGYMLAGVSTKAALVATKKFMPKK
jgi:hypothetical protein